MFINSKDIHSLFCLGMKIKSAVLMAQWHAQRGFVCMMDVTESAATSLLLKALLPTLLPNTCPQGMQAIVYKMNQKALRLMYGPNGSLLMPRHHWPMRFSLMQYDLPRMFEGSG